MATRRFQQFQGTLEKQIVKLFANISIGAAGAPTLNSNGSLGIASVTLTSPGLYEVTLSDQYSKLMNVHSQQVVAVAEDLNFQLKSETMSTKKFELHCLTAGVATDPSSGSILLLEITLRNTSVQK